MFISETGCVRGAAGCEDAMWASGRQRGAFAVRVMYERSCTLILWVRALRDHEWARIGHFEHTRQERARPAARRERAAREREAARKLEARDRSGARAERERDENERERSAVAWSVTYAARTAHNT